MSAIKAIILGGGQRGLVFSNYAKAYPNELKIVAVAEPRHDRLEEFGKVHNIPEEDLVSEWTELLSRPKFADLVIVTTQDNMHYEPAMKAMELGYDVLCEKPMSKDPKELIAMRDKAAETGRKLAVCHSLRYSVFFTEIKELLDSGAIGELVSIQHIESIGFWHMAHSFVRGNWRRKEETSPIIMAKCCHDLDILTWLCDGDIDYISSFGSLKHFKKENKPEGSPERCMDGCDYRDECPYYAPRFYLEHKRSTNDGFRKIVSNDTSEEAVLKALADGPYGRCVYSCDNDVPDNQVVNIMYDNGVTVSMAMCAFTDNCERVINLMGTHGQIRGNMDLATLTVNDFATGHEYTVKLHSPTGTHGGSDVIMIKEICRDIKIPGAESRSSVAKSVQSHLACLAAEESRLENGKSISFKEWCSKFGS